MSYAAGVDNNQLRLAGAVEMLEAELLKQLSCLLAFVLIDFAAKSIYSKSLHNMV